MSYGHTTTEFTAWCGHDVNKDSMCSTWEQISEPSLALAKKRFKTLGWTWTRANGWRCPEHSKGKT